MLPPLPRHLTLWLMLALLLAACQGEPPTSTPTLTLPTSAATTPVPTATEAPSPTPSPTFTPPPSATATTDIGKLAQAPWPACPGVIYSRLRPGMVAYVSSDPPLSNRLRSGPGTANEMTGLLAPGTRLELKAGPECGGGYIWWQVEASSEGLSGWTAEGKDNEYWLTPCSPDFLCYVLADSALASTAIALAPPPGIPTAPPPAPTSPAVEAPTQPATQPPPASATPGAVSAPVAGKPGAAPPGLLPDSWIVFSAQDGAGESARAINPANGAQVVYALSGPPGLAPHASPDGSQIVTALPGALLRFYPETGDERTLSLPQGFVPRDPVFSPLMSRIAFGAGEIYLILANGQGLAALTQSGRQFEQLAWSPDGRSLLAASANPAGRRVVSRIPLDNGAITDLIAGEHPAWSPDGSLVAYTSDGQMSVMDANGQFLYSLPVTSAGSIAWSPDGQWLAYVDLACSTRCIALVRADGSQGPFLAWDGPELEGRLSWIK